MKSYFPIVLYIVVTLSQEIFGEKDNEIQRGTYPSMAFLYYRDETVIDSSGSRFFQSGVLIRPDWLVTSAVSPSVNSNVSEDFSKKTLIARLGAIIIDPNFNLNDDEDEQEREITQIVTPFNHNASQWWRTDIILMKTLYPFNITNVVNAIDLNNKAEYDDKSCVVLVYARNSTNKSGGMSLMQLSVQLLPPSLENCGRHFVENTMICASDSDETTNVVYDSEYCGGNSGGPLICEGDVIGLQTYINNNCRQPHLYQLLSAWDNFIKCGIEDKCDEEQCSNICINSNKDEDVPVHEGAITNNNEDHKVNPVDVTINFTDKIDTTLTLATVTKEDMEITPTHSIKIESPVSDAITTDTLHTLETSLNLNSWPQKINANVKLQNANENVERKPNVEAHQLDIVQKPYNSVQKTVLDLEPRFIACLLFLTLI